MAYSPDAVEVLDETSEIPPETSEESSGKTFFIAPEYQDDVIANANPGDVVQIRVVGKDATGAVEAECFKEGGEEAGEEDWEGSLDNAMPESFGGKMKDTM